MPGKKQPTLPNLLMPAQQKQHLLKEVTIVLALDTGWQRSECGPQGSREQLSGACNTEKQFKDDPPPCLSQNMEQGKPPTWADLRTEIRGQVTGLPKAGFTDPIRLDDGWHILKLLDTEASHTRPLVEVRDALVQRIRAERVEANRRAYVAELLKQSPPVVNEIALSKLLDTKSATAPAR